MNCVVTRRGNATSARSQLLAADFTWSKLPEQRKRISVTWITTLLAALATGHALGQEVNANLLVSPACVEMNRTMMAEVANGQAAAAETRLSAVLTAVDRGLDACAGLVLNNMAALIFVSGRTAEAERL